MDRSPELLSTEGVLINWLGIYYQKRKALKLTGPKRLALLTLATVERVRTVSGVLLSEFKFSWCDVG